LTSSLKKPIKTVSLKKNSFDLASHSRKVSKIAASPSFVRHHSRSITAINESSPKRKKSISR